MTGRVDLYSLVAGEPTANLLDVPTEIATPLRDHLPRPQGLTLVDKITAIQRFFTQNHFRYTLQLPPSLPEGVVYTDSIAFGNARQQFAGGSAAQSSILQVIDATLGIKHSQAFLEEMQQYMPRKHREYIHFVQAKAKAGGCVAQTLDAVAVRVKTKNEAVKDALREATAMYDACIEAITQFRNVHMEMVKVYIISEQRKVAVQEARARGERTLGDAAGGKGTGGTGIMSFLQPVRNETRDMKRLGSSSVDE